MRVHRKRGECKCSEDVSKTRAPAEARDGEQRTSAEDGHSGSALSPNENSIQQGVEIIKRPKTPPARARARSRRTRGAGSPRGRAGAALKNCLPSSRGANQGLAVCSNGSSAA